jgi:hypothetical protein
MRTPQDAEPEKVKASAAVERERVRFEILKQAIADIGFFRRGTLTRVRVRCGKDSCACATDPDKRHGPYVQWTRKLAGKTVSERIAREHVPLLEEWIHNARELERLLDEMQQVSLRATRRILGQRGERARRK